MMENRLVKQNKKYEFKLYFNNFQLMSTYSKLANLLAKTKSSWNDNRAVQSWSGHLEFFQENFGLEIAVVQAKSQTVAQTNIPQYWQHSSICWYETPHTHCTWETR